MDETIFDKVQEIDLKKTMETSYIDYAMSVIASRALPDVRDGLKPVQRRILYSMTELNNGPDKPHRKCARIVGDTMGKYHPHGDSSIYEALVKLAQDFATRYPLVDGHGNFGSVDGDGAAAMRYTEARLSWISKEMLADINKDTVDFAPNFDDTEKEPTVLPSRYPNLLVNGTSGIAVGMATNIPPHNLHEVISGVVKMIDNRIEEDRDTEIEELLEIIKGPDFPTGAEIIGCLCQWGLSESRWQSFPKKRCSLPWILTPKHRRLQQPVRSQIRQSRRKPAQSLMKIQTDILWRCNTPCHCTERGSNPHSSRCARWCHLPAG